MKRIMPMMVVLALAIAITVASQLLLGSISNSKAATEAFKLWGINSYTGTDHPFIKTNETKKIGYMSPGCQDEITIVGRGDNSWDAAFASLPTDNGIGATVHGMYYLQFQYPGTTSPPAILTDPAPGVVTAVRAIIDGQPVGDETPTGVTDMSPWIVNVPWDSTTVPDGFHVLCALQIHADGSFAKSHATMLVVKQMP